MRQADQRQEAGEKLGQDERGGENMTAYMKFAESERR